jgi:ankyrin repeat protein
MDLYTVLHPIILAGDVQKLLQIAINLIEALVKLLGGNIINKSPLLRKSYDPPLFWAASCGYVELFKKMVALGADPNARTTNGCTMLHKAVLGWYGHHALTPMIKLVLSYGVNIDERDYFGQTPLFLAVDNNHIDAVETLCQCGSKAVNTQSNCDTPLNIAKSVDMIGLLIRYEATVNTGCEICMPKELTALGFLPHNRQNLDDDYVTEIRYRVYFSRSLVERLFDQIRSFQVLEELISTSSSAIQDS